MDQDFGIYLHLAFIVPALIFGPVILLRQKGDQSHKRLGQFWAYSMIIGSLLSFRIRTNGHFTWLHGLAAFTIFSVIQGIRRIRAKDLKGHKRAMVGSYIGVSTAFLFTLDPSRLLGSMLKRFLTGE